jgi:hypothetical protein
MKTLTLSAEPLEMVQYRLAQNIPVYSCASYLQYFGIARDMSRDQSWETFVVPALDMYFLNGISKFQKEFEDFSNLASSYSVEKEKQLVFMLDALIHAKELILELDCKRT